MNYEDETPKNKLIRLFRATRDVYAEAASRMQTGSEAKIRYLAKMDAFDVAASTVRDEIP